MGKNETKIVAVSGGKDSTALALALQEFEPDDYVFIANPTGNELPEMIEHLEWLRGKLGHLHIVGDGRTFEQLIYDEKMIPNFRARFCTRILKIEPTQYFIEQFDNPVLYVGLRADEKARSGIYGVKSRLPFHEWKWGLHDVWQFLNKRGVTIPARTDCAWCFFQRMDEWWSLWRYYPKLWKQGERIEKDLNATFRTPNKDKWPTAMKDMRKIFSKGHAPRKAPLQRSLVCAACRL